MSECQETIRCTHCGANRDVNAWCGSEECDDWQSERQAEIDSIVRGPRSKDEVMARYVYRSADDGRFIAKAQADTNPNGTVRERVPDSTELAEVLDALTQLHDAGRAATEAGTRLSQATQALTDAMRAQHD